MFLGGAFIDAPTAANSMMLKAFTLTGTFGRLNPEDMKSQLGCGEKNNLLIT